MSPRRSLLLLSALALVAAACASSAPSASPSGAVCGTAPDSPPRPPGERRGHPAASDAHAGPRLERDHLRQGPDPVPLPRQCQQRVASAPDRKATVAFYNLGRDPNKAVVTADGQFVWTIKDERGMYVVDVDLPEAGMWGAEFTTTATDAAGVETGEPSA